MALMLFIDTIPECAGVDWNTSDMQDLVDATYTETPARNTPAMGAKLLKVALDLGEHFQHWASVQRNLFSVLSQAVSNTSAHDNVDCSTDSIPFSRSMKMDRHGRHVAAHPGGVTPRVRGSRRAPAASWLGPLPLSSLVV
jgi:hypothetical protein